MSVFNASTITGRSTKTCAELGKLHREPLSKQPTVRAKQWLLVRSCSQYCACQQGHHNAWNGAAGSCAIKLASFIWRGDSCCYHNVGSQSRPGATIAWLGYFVTCRQHLSSLGTGGPERALSCGAMQWMHNLSKWSLRAVMLAMSDVCDRINHVLENRQATL